MVKKIIKVDLNFPPTPDPETVVEDNTHVDEYSVAQAEATSHDEEVVKSVVEENTTQKPKRPSRKAPSKVIEAKIPSDVVEEKTIIEPIIEPVVEPIIEPVVEKKNIKTVEMIECPQCKKMMTAKSLKYSHQKNCLSNKPTVEVEKKVVKATPVKQEPKQEPKQEQQYEQPQATVVQVLHPLERLSQTRATRMQKRVQTYQALVANAF